MSLISYTTTCTRKILVAPNVYELAFEKPLNFSFKPGQFILFDVPLVTNPADIQPRAYSLASTEDESELLFIIKLKAGGRFSEWLVQSLSVGTTVTFKGPFGLFTLRENNHDCFFAGTGAGIAPFRAQIRAALQAKDTRAMHLFFGVRERKDLFWVEEFEAMQRISPQFHLHLCLSGKDESWEGNLGRVQQFIPSLIKDPAKTDLYICGAPDMVADIKKSAMESWLLPKANVHAEGYI